eukprot:scaffold3.g6187.t1
MAADAVVRPRGYSYVELAEACAMSGRGGVVNLYAIVAECALPRRTKGTDMVCNLFLVDPSISDDQEHRDGVELLCFAPHQRDLPHLRRPGDIVRLHRVKVQQFNGRAQLMGKLGGRWAGPQFSFCLFDAGGGDAPYQHSHRAYHFDPREAEILGTFRQYVTLRGRQHLLGHSEYLRRIRDVRPGAFFDVVALVAAVDESSPGWRVTWLWDASDALPLPVTCDTRASEDADPAVAQELRPLAVPFADMEDTGGIPKLGSLLPVVSQTAGNVAEWPKAGSWVKMRNLGARAVTGQLQAFYHRNSKWMVWEESAELMEEYEQRLAANHVAGWSPPAQANYLAISGHPGQPFTTLRQVLMETSFKQPNYYRCLVRLMDYSPKDPGLTHTAAACGLPPAYPHPRTYTIQLLLEDATAQLDAQLFGPAADAFFNGQPAPDMRADAAAREALVNKLDRLLGLGCERNGGPWMEVVLKVHFRDLDQPWETREYLIEDTWLTLSP